MPLGTTTLADTGLNAERVVEFGVAVLGVGGIALAAGRERRDVPPPGEDAGA